MAKEPIIPLFSENCSLLQTSLGAFAVFIFISTWLTSLMSPLLLCISVQSQNYTVTSIILLTAAAAHISFWNTKGTLPRMIKTFINTYHPKYYNRCKVLFEDSLPDTSSTAKRPTFYAVHPHGAVSLGWSILFASHFMDSVRFCFSPALYYSPFFKLFSMIVGNPGKADKKSMISYMKRGENLALPPGGFEEATITYQHQDRAYIKKRTGFVKLCLQHGYSLVPVYCFGEKDTFWNLQGSWSMRLKMNYLGMPAILIWGSKLWPFLPKRSRNGLFIVAGKRMDLPKIENPTRDEVKLWHDKYMAALLHIFEKHKHDAYGDDAKSMKLELW